MGHPVFFFVTSGVLRRGRGDMQYLRIKQVLKDPCLPPEMAMARQEMNFVYNSWLDQNGLIGKEPCGQSSFNTSQDQHNHHLVY